MMETTKKSAWGLWATLGGLAAIAAGGAYFYYKVILGEALTPLDAAKFVPDETLMATYISTDAQAWSKINEFGTPEAQKILNQQWQDLTSEMTNDSKISYEQDLKPWLGNVMFAVLPVTDKNKDDNILLVVGIKNKAKALQFANKMKGTLKDLKEIEYKGFSISQGLTEKNEPFSFTLVNDYLVVASGQNTINSSIDAFKGEPSLATQSKDTELFNQELDIKNPLAQVYFPNYSSLVAESFKGLEELEKSEGLEKNPDDVSNKLIEKFNQVESIVVGVGIEDDGIHFQAITKLNPDVKLDFFKPYQGKILEQFPQETFLLVAGQGISQTWNYAITQMQDIPEFKTGLDEIRKGVKEELKLDLDKDILGWMNGEFAYGLISSKKGGLSTLGMGGAFALETSDRPTGEKTINTISKFFEPQFSGYIVPSETKVGDVQVKQWKTPLQEDILSYGWKDKNLFLMTMGTPFKDFVELSQQNSLAKSEKFKNMMQSLPKDTAGYFYLDLQQANTVINTITQLSGQPIPPEVKAFLDSIKGVGMTSTIPQNSLTQTDVIVSLEKAKVQ
jgi:hypothetical protein